MGDGAPDAAASTDGDAHERRLAARSWAASTVRGPGNRAAAASAAASRAGLSACTRGQGEAAAKSMGKPKEFVDSAVPGADAKPPPPSPTIPSAAAPFPFPSPSSSWPAPDACKVGRSNGGAIGTGADGRSLATSRVAAAAAAMAAWGGSKAGAGAGESVLTPQRSGSGPEGRWMG